MIIHLGYNVRGVFNSSFHDVQADAKAQMAMSVRQGRLNEGHIDVDEAPVKQRWQLGQKNRRVICLTRVDGIPRCIADKERIVPKVLLKFFFGIRGYAEGPHMNDFRIEKGMGL
jgi:hypothetical protein